MPAAITAPMTIGLCVVGPKGNINTMQCILPGKLTKVAGRPPAIAQPGFENRNRFLLIYCKRNNTRWLNEPCFISYRVHHIEVAKAANESGCIGNKNGL